jgi:predicted nuclease of predicted toxin-antitoxin system
MKFLADMGVAGKVVDWLVQAGHDAVHLRDEGLQRVSDPDIFAKAHQEGRIVLTFDLDFGEIVALSGSTHTSVILFRVRNASAAHIIQRLSVVLPSCADVLAEGAVVLVEDGRYRVRRFPINR